MNFRKNSKGITLIALVITIIVLLILAGISLKLISGNSGILKRTQNAETKMREATIKEDVEMVVSGESISYYTAENKEPTLGEYLFEKSSDDGFEGRDDSRIYFESIEEGIVYITHEDKNGNKTFLTMNLDGSNLRIVGRGNSNETIDVIAPTLQITSTTTQSITFTSTDRVGVAYYQITEENSEPSNWESVEITKKLEKTIFDLENNKTYYIWVKDEAGNVRSKEVVTADFEMLSHEMEWDGTTATITVTSPKTGVQYKIGTSGTWTDYSETNKPTVPSGTEVFFQATDGKNWKQYSSVTPWIPFTITYDLYGGTGEVPEPRTASPGETIKVNFNSKPVKEGFEFVGWLDYYVSSTSYYSENGTKEFTMPNRDVTLTAAWYSKITAEDIANNPKQYIGNGVTLKSKYTNSWSIFFADNDNIYLKTSSPVRISNLPTGKNDSSVREQNSYPTHGQLSGVYEDYEKGTGDISSENPAKMKWMKMYNYSGTNINQKALAYMLDTDRWTSSFAVGASLDDDGSPVGVEYVIGGPTAELYVASWNACRPENTIDLEVGNAQGYRFKYKSSSSFSTSITLESLPSGLGTARVSSSEYWVFASPGRINSNTNNMVAFNVKESSSSVTCKLMTYSAGNYVSFNPIVCLKKDTVLEKINDNYYTILMEEKE